jgi:hypothetical protein
MMEHLLLRSEQNPLEIEQMDNSMTATIQARCIQQFEMQRSARLLGVSDDTKSQLIYQPAGQNMPNIVRSIECTIKITVMSI